MTLSTRPTATQLPRGVQLGRGEPADPITGWICETVDLEHGASAGLILFTVGGVAATDMAVEWITSGYTARPQLVRVLVAFIAIVLGVQTVFYSFFLSLLAQAREHEGSVSTAETATDVELTDTEVRASREDCDERGSGSDGPEDG